MLHPVVSRAVSAALLLTAPLVALAEPSPLDVSTVSASYLMAEHARGEGEGVRLEWRQGLARHLYLEAGGSWREIAFEAGGGRAEVLMAGASLNAYAQLFDDVLLVHAGAGYTVLDAQSRGRVDNRIEGPTPWSVDDAACLSALCTMGGVHNFDDEAEGVEVILGMRLEPATGVELFGQLRTRGLDRALGDSSDDISTARFGAGYQRGPWSAWIARSEHNALDIAETELTLRYHF